MMEKFQKLALLIDAENVALDKLESVIRKISAYGRIVIQRAYGDWSKESLKNWKDSLNRFGIKAEQQFNYTPKKNSTDMALTIDALDLLYQSSYDALAIVSSDCDFTPVSLYVREHGVYVIGIGKKDTPESFQKACDKFIKLEDLDIKTNADPSKSSQTAPAIHGITIPPIHEMLKEAVKKNQDPNGYAPIGAAAYYLKKTYGCTWITYGRKKFLNLIKLFPDKYEIKEITPTVIKYKLK
ncbi:NYN domain-containing protein [Akkermansia muciniphila]|uniref:NYN domain-containing protein n=1 Tax=Akkermansia muciniphila TaxID=239935 RepID=UPI0027D27FAD|nr:NYN domain-containing protein [Akkermansia muciniphila]WMB16055.1 NYN domain-containing protein [Akkermansia muciniphila]WMB20631.1 NYN domain-containing protein [Akkermansia muciniphila]